MRRHGGHEKSSCDKNELSLQMYEAIYSFLFLTIYHVQHHMMIIMKFDFWLKRQPNHFITTIGFRGHNVVFVL